MELILLLGIAIFVIIYRSGNGQQAYKEAAKKGHTASEFMYAYMLLVGEAGHRDIKTGTKYLKRAARAGYANAVLLLARNFYYGYGVNRDEK